MEALVAILVPLAAFAAFFGAFYIYFATRNKERMAMIEKGVDMSILEPKGKQGNGLTTIKIGIFLVGVGIGILVGYFLNAYAGLDDAPAYWSMILVFGGAGLILGNKLDKSKSDGIANEI